MKCLSSNADDVLIVNPAGPEKSFGFMVSVSMNSHRICLSIVRLDAFQKRSIQDANLVALMLLSEKTGPPPKLALSSGAMSM